MRESDMEPTLDMNGAGVDSRGRVSRAQLLRLGVWFTLALWLAAAVLPLPFGRPGVWSALGLAGFLSWQTALGGVLGLAVGATVAALMIHWRPLHVVVERLAGLVAWDTLRTPDYVAVALMAALGEEPLFRGALQPLIGLGFTAALFGLLHATSAAHVVLAYLLGLLLGWLYQWSGSLWPSIAAHLTIDLATGLLLARTLRQRVSSARGG
jgi:membrane protease YdiL (CAAX protease family)